MDSNTHSITQSTRLGAGRPDHLASLAVAVDGLAALDLDGLTDAALAEQVLALRRLVDRLEGHWLRQLAAVDGRGAAGADQGQEVGSTAGWLRSRLRLGAGAAASCVRTARALFRGPLAATASALTGGEISVAHAGVLAHGTQELPAHADCRGRAGAGGGGVSAGSASAAAGPGHLQLVADPDGADRRAERRHGRRGLWLAPTLDGMVAVDGLLEPEAGQSLLAALEPLARPADANDTRSGSQRNADALAELARRALEGGRLPQVGGVRPQLMVTVDLDSLVGRHGPLGGEVGWAGPLDPEACRRLACDSAVTRVLVTRHPRPSPSPPRATPTLVAEQDHTLRPEPVQPVAVPGGAGRSGCGRRWRCCPRSWGVRRPSRWRSAGPAGSSRPPNGPPWRFVTVAVCSLAVRGRWPGARPIICATGCMVARPIWPTWPCCAGRIIGRSMRGAGSWPARLMGG